MGGLQQVEELYLRCLSEISDEDASTRIDMRDAADELADRARHGEDLRPLIERIRISSGIDNPVGEGVHMLTGHAGKGQGFDEVIILGFDEGQIPSFFVQNLAPDDPAVSEELALLHVMASRAKGELVFTMCERTNGHAQRPSRWLSLVSRFAETV